jgi:hypothetical protein
MELGFGGWRVSAEDASVHASIAKTVVRKRISTSIPSWFADVVIDGQVLMTASPSLFLRKSLNGDADPTRRLAIAH